MFAVAAIVFGGPGAPLFNATAASVLFRVVLLGVLLSLVPPAARSSDGPGRAARTRRR